MIPEIDLEILKDFIRARYLGSDIGVLYCSR